jgi:hypothetical protein
MPQYLVRQVFESSETGCTDLTLRQGQKENSRLSPLDVLGCNSSARTAAIARCAGYGASTQFEMDGRASASANAAMRDSDQTHAETAIRPPTNVRQRLGTAFGTAWLTSTMLKC